MKKFLKNNWLVLTIPSITKLTKEKRKKSNKENITKFFYQAYKYIYLLPLIGLILILICTFSTTLNPEYSNIYRTSLWK